MNIKISSIATAHSTDWNCVWENCSYATYFQSSEWAEIWEKYTDGSLKPTPILCTFSDGSKALLPLSAQRVMRGMIKQYLSSPAGTFGGWIASDELSKDHCQLLVDYMCNSLGSIIWRLNPYDKVVTKLKYPKLINDETHVLNLKEGFDSLSHSWTKGHKSVTTKARKASKSGIIILKATKQEDWEEYYKVYLDSLERWGETASSKYEWKLFEIIYNMISKNIHLWIAKYGNKIVAGALCFYSKNHVVYWHGAALSDYLNIRPVNLLMYEIIKDACDRGYAWFDFNPSGGHEGVKSFKKSFGTMELSCNIIEIKSFTFRCLSKIALIKHHIAR